MSTLRERLDDLLADTPSYVAPDVAAARRDGGRRRRFRRSVAGGLVVAASLVLLGAMVAVPVVLPELAPTGGDGAAAVTGYPTRVDDPLWIRDLPERPGPLAGLMDSPEPGWRGVSATGDVWDLDFVESGAADAYPSLSPDGTRLAYLDRGHRFAVRNLVTGDTTVFPDIGDGRAEGDGPSIFWGGQTPITWSPDGDRLLLVGGPLERSRPRGPVLVDFAARASHALDLPVGWPAGWLDDTTFVYVASVRGEVMTVDADGSVVASARLRPFRAGGSWSQFSPSLAVGGETLAMTTQRVANGTERTVRFDLQSGRRYGGGVETAAVNEHCETSHGPYGPALPTTRTDGVTRLEPLGGGGLVSVDPSLGARCLTFVADALAGKPHRSLGDRLLDGVAVGPVTTPDLSRTWLAWHRPEAGAGLVAAALLVLLWPLVVVLRRRKHRVADPRGSA